VALQIIRPKAMTRTDLIFWLSIVWFAGLCGAAVWALF
jgi:hypothetical protein